MSTSTLPAAWKAAEVDTIDGTGTTRQKEDLVKVPFLIGHIKFFKGDFGPAVALTAVDTSNAEFVFVDGSTGVYRQVVNHLHNHGMLDKKIENPDSQEYDVRLLCANGLRVSTYTYTDADGKTKPASTYYVA